MQGQHLYSLCGMISLLYILIFLDVVNVKYDFTSKIYCSFHNLMQPGITNSKIYSII